MSENEEKKPKHVFRIALRGQSEEILENWKAQLQQVFPAFEPSTPDLVSWAIERSPQITKKEIQEIKARFFDDVKELESLLLRVKKAKAEGNETEVGELLSNITIRRKNSATETTQIPEN